jgi:hypothetical protein
VAALPAGLLTSIELWSLDVDGIEPHLVRWVSGATVLVCRDWHSGSPAPMMRA